MRIIDWDITQLKQSLREQITQKTPIPMIDITASYDGHELWQAEIGLVKSQIINLAEKNSLEKRVIELFEYVGIMELTITQAYSKKELKTTQVGWEDEFISWVTLENKSYNMYAFPDTNFLKRRYSLGLSRKLGDKRFNQMLFRIPRLVILEIESRYNKFKKIAYEGKPTKEGDSSHITNAFIEMRADLIATQELMFLLSAGATTLNSSTDIDLFTLSKSFGDGFADAFIRDEILKGTKNFSIAQPKFLTCDLIDALAAEAEGLSTLFFSRMPRSTYQLPRDFENNLELFVNLIYYTAFLLGEASFKITIGKNPAITKKLKGWWDGWSITDLENKRILENC